MTTRPPAPLTPDEAARRRFLVCSCAILAVPLAAEIGIPLVSAVVGVIYRRHPLEFSKTEGFATATIGQPISVRITRRDTDAYLESESTEEVFVIKQGPAEATVLSPICPHMGCRTTWNQGQKNFICPCHNSVFSVSGQVISGPSPRSLDTLAHKIEDGTLYVQWEQFQSGVQEKSGI